MSIELVGLICSSYLLLILKQTQSSAAIQKYLLFIFLNTWFIFLRRTVHFLTVMFCPRATRFRMLLWAMQFFLLNADDGS